ncbi:hypothetical protein LEP1GSC036_1826 [Leptospira weilii str. 2006001853]|uniref:Uncharacterized protein n=2 Tax=Leptospira weilii TaxID=28184 RepID=A0A828YV38_9LEPT|nr:hypothetical protein LEP1GSC036_1826 [Leptospira weilii str. 2006001853]EMM72565.1 hypothetical protein LEP1GSC038_0553 [Leptospira weilii str. 2006001855]EMN44525.1 hypothetical protein LEP1GSC086_2001 [Leptospira weilii str. LNT 1234]QDK25185.1 hypothetical protein FHG67_20245 [Leptospira weilii]QDK29086.1 hypothetical protein FHG68_19990 [Leptospira weilii]
MTGHFKIQEEFVGGLTKKEEYLLRKGFWSRSSYRIHVSLRNHKFLPLKNFSGDLKKILKTQI